MTEKPLRLRDRRAQQTREEILRAARRAVRQRGYSRTSVRDVARGRRGVGPDRLRQRRVEAGAGRPAQRPDRRRGGDRRDRRRPAAVARTRRAGGRSARVTRSIVEHCGDIVHAPRDRGRRRARAAGRPGPRDTDDTSRVRCTAWGLLASARRALDPARKPGAAAADPRRAHRLPVRRVAQRHLRLVAATASRPGWPRPAGPSCCAVSTDRSSRLTDRCSTQGRRSLLDQLQADESGDVEDAARPPRRRPRGPHTAGSPVVVPGGVVEDLPDLPRRGPPRCS